LAETYVEDLAVIRYHAWWPSSNEPYYAFNPTENTARIQYYPPHTDGYYYTPYAWIDGTVRGSYSYNSWGSMINSELTVSSPLEIDISGEYDPSSREGNMQITVTATELIEYTNLKLRIAITESNLYWAAPNGTNRHHQTFRDMIPGTSGIAFSISEGDTEVFNQPFSLHTDLDEDNCEIVVFVQSDNGRRILQGAKKDVMSLGLPGEFLPFSLISPEDEEIVDTCYPTFIWHSTSEPGWDDDVYYDVSVSPDPTFPDPITSGPQLDTTWLSPVCLNDGVTYYWRVLASNGHASDRFCDAVFSFTVDESGDCVYVAGDCNNNGVPLELGDVVTMIGLYRGSTEPSYVCDCGVDPPGPEFPATADPNGNCVPMELSDVVTEIGAYRGSEEASGCADCPGTNRIALGDKRGYPQKSSGK
jgi:hypothetical protein